MQNSLILLASTSIHRQKVLTQAGVPHLVVPSSFNESQIDDPDPAERAIKRARGKAEAVARLNPGALVIGADQVAFFQGCFLTKPCVKEEAISQLLALQGKTHVLYSAYVLLTQGENIQELSARVVEIPMTMRPLSSAEVEVYVATGEWQGCVGGYRAEEKGAYLFSSLGGEASAIIGLPMIPLLADLRKYGKIRLENERKDEKCP